MLKHDNMSWEDFFNSLTKEQQEEIAKNMREDIIQYPHRINYNFPNENLVTFDVINMPIPSVGQVVYLRNLDLRIDNPNRSKEYDYAQGQVASKWKVTRVELGMLVPSERFDRYTKNPKVSYFVDLERLED